MRYNFTATDVEAKVREIAAADPGHVYQDPQNGGCTNIAARGGEACLIGQALMALGVPEAAFVECNVVDGSAAEVFNTFDIPDEEIDWLEQVQSLQDGRVPWGECVARADDEFRRPPVAAPTS